MSDERDYGEPQWEGEFDAQRAWNTIQTLRDENRTLKGRPVITDQQQQMLDEYQTLVDASQTDIERLQSQLEEAQSQAGQVQAVQAANLRLEVAMAKGIPAPLVPRLQGATREELEADADTLMGMVTPPQGAPRPNPAQGTSGGAGNGPSIEERIRQAEKDGDIREAIRLNTAKLLAEKRTR